MANVVAPGRCEACDRPLPAQQGRGRRRRFCGATCRSAARRERELSRREPDAAQEPLTRDRRPAGSPVPGREPCGADALAARIHLAARHLVAELGRPAAGSPLDALAAARELSSVTDMALRAAVDQARAAGQSWSKIGDVLGTTRQAAFQRFGRPADPGT